MRRMYEIPRTLISSEVLELEVAGCALSLLTIEQQRAGLSLESR